MHINSIHVEETILEKLFTFSNKSKDRLSKRTNVEHLAWPKSIYHNSQLINHRLLTSMLRTTGQVISQLFKASMWFKYMGSLHGMWSIGTEIEKQSLNVNNRNCKMGKMRNKIPHFKVTRMRYADDKFTHTRLNSWCQWMGNDKQK